MPKKQLLELNRIDLLHEALERFVRRIGQAKVGSFGVSMPKSAGVRLLDIEFDFAGYRDRCLRQHFRSGVWTVERQKVTRDWHIHALVELGFDGQTGFPFEAIKKKDYSFVPHRFRKLWKSLRDAAAESGYGVSNIMPVEAGVMGRLVTYNRPHLLPIEPRKADRLISYMSGRPLVEQENWKEPPEGCGSWGEPAGRKNPGRVVTGYVGREWYRVAIVEGGVASGVN